MVERQWIFWPYQRQKCSVSNLLPFTFLILQMEHPVFGFYVTTTHDLSLNWRVQILANICFCHSSQTIFKEPCMHRQPNYHQSVDFLFPWLTKVVICMSKHYSFILSYLHYFGKSFWKTTWSKSSHIPCFFKQRRNTVQFLFFGVFLRQFSY